jgi:hypothetical protein
LSSKPSTEIDSDALMKNTVRSITNTDDSAMGTRQTFVPLSFKVTKSFKKRYQQAALDADMKLNELLSAMLDQWEEKRSMNKARKT